MDQPSDSPYDFVPQDPSIPPSEPAAPATPAETVIERSCPHCGFRILGKTRGNRCPDCSGPLDAAVDLLQFSDPDTLRRMSWASVAIAAAPPLHILAAILARLSGVAFAGFLHLIGAILVLVGTWILTFRDAHQSRPLMAALSRAFVIVAGLFWIIALIASRSTTAREWTTIIALTFMAAETLCLGFFLNGLAARIPNDPLAAQFQNLGWIMLIVFAFMILFHLWDLQDYFFSIFFCSFPLVGVLLVIIGWCVWALMRLAVDLHNVAVAADVSLEKRQKRAATAE